MTGSRRQILTGVNFGKDGLVPAVAQQFDTGRLLMLAWMSAEALVETIETGRAVYWSRSRQSLWRKGESSGQIQTVREVRLDCDGDAVVLLVDQQGVACHTGRRSCFFRRWKDGEWRTTDPVEIDPAMLYPGA